jgi:Uma2 family endonuclease
MSMPARSATGITIEDWVNAARGPYERAEISNGEFVFRRVGGNPHHFVAHRLAEEFMRQWPEVIAAPPGHWALECTSEGRVIRGRFPDVLVDGESLITDPVFVGVPHVVVEVWSPENTLAEMNAKRFEYCAAGAPVFLEGFLTEDGDVHLEWQELDRGRWQFVAAAQGERELRVEGPRPFAVVPNDLLRRA